MPELPQMRALAERLTEALDHRLFTTYKLFGFSGLKTARPAPEDVVGCQLEAITTRGKYLVVSFDSGHRMLIHLSQAGRLDVEQPPKTTKPKGVVARLNFDDVALLLREYGTEKKAGWWVLDAGDDGPLARLGPEADSDEFTQLIRTSDDGRRVHTLLRDQQTVAGIGRGYSDDVLHRAKLSPFAVVKALSVDERERLLQTINEVMTEAINKERTRTGGLSQAKLGEHFTVHGRTGSPCPMCGDTLQRISYESHEVTYCPTCQTQGKTLADRRLSRLLK